MRHRQLALVVAALVAVQLVAAAPVVARSTEGLSPAPDTVTPLVAVTVSAEILPQVAGPITATVTVSPDPGGGSIVWHVDFGADTVTPVAPGGVTTIDLGSLNAGTRTLWYSFSGFDTFEATGTLSTQFSVLTPSTTTLVADRSTAYAGELPVKLTATVTSPDDLASTVTFLDDVAGEVVELGPVAVDATSHQAVFSAKTLRLGVHSIRAQYSGTAWTGGSLSDPVTVTVLADTAVHATFTRSLSTFYPYKDGIKDTVRLGGVLSETASVTIRLYNSSGTRKRTWSLGTKSPGSYGVTWNGTTATGSKLPAGKYKVIASFRDVPGHTRSITTYVTLSWREAVWKTGAAITRYGDQWTYYADQSTDRLFYSPDYSRGRTMDSGPMIRDCVGCGWIYGKRTYQLNTSGIAFKGIYATMVGHGYSDREHTGEGYVVNPANGEWVYTGAVPPEYLDMGYAVNIVVKPQYVSSTKQVKLVIAMTQAWGDAWDMHYVKLYYKYAVWK